MTLLHQLKVCQMSSVYSSILCDQRNVSIHLHRVQLNPQQNHVRLAVHFLVDASTQTRFRCNACLSSIHLSHAQWPVSRTKLLPNQHVAAQLKHLSPLLHGQIFIFLFLWPNLDYIKCKLSKYKNLCAKNKNIADIS